MKKNILLMIIIITITFLPIKVYKAMDYSDSTNPNVSYKKYSGISTCTDVDINKIKACGCIPAGIADITSKAYFLLRVFAPVLLLIIGGFDLVKAISSSDEKSIAKAQKKLVNKFIAAAAIFLVPMFVKFAVSLVADNIDDTFQCINILLDGYKI